MRGREWIKIAGLGLCLLLGILCACGTGEEQEEQETAPSQEDTLTYGNQTLPIQSSLAVNEYDGDLFVFDESGLCSYQGEGYVSMAGIDISAHQGEVDWQKVAAAGVEFVMLRAGFRGYETGSLNLDSRFEENIQGALEAGLQVGVYFFSQAVTVQEAREEAAFVLEAIDGYDVTLPVAFDWEYISDAEARTDGVSSEELTRFAAAFCAAVEEGGCQAMVYFYVDLGYISYDLTQLREYGFWLSEYADSPSFYYHFSMWQYSNSGVIDGISEAVDLNIYLMMSQ
ncbi:MAG: glycoside hydrolase family 25 protein [Oscillospiraceae bacterium]|nr:glycoside hydrolase family 25 protein [Oscillospiraceae bacterium]